jgi:hypothetical protein
VKKIRREAWPILDSAQRELVRHVLSALRKTYETDVPADERELDEVLEALRMCGYVVIPRGILDSMRRLLG